jgi:hypothetical protein
MPMAQGAAGLATVSPENAKVGARKNVRKATAVVTRCGCGWEESFEG